jgi:hypothetical protein
MPSVRQAPVSHLDTVATFSLKALGIDSGIYDGSHLRAILKEPDTIIRLEQVWIGDLLEAMRIIQRYMGLVERWANHIYGLEHSLGVKETDEARIQRGEVSAVDLLAAKSFDKDYLRWVLADTAEELDRLAVANAELLAEVPRLAELVQKFGGAYFEQVHSVAEGWLAGGRFDFSKELVAIIETAYRETNVKGMVRQIGRYLDMMARIVTSGAVFVGTAPSTLYTPKLWATHSAVVTQLVHSTEELNEFVWRRSQVYMFLIRHQEALLQAVLPPTTSITEWLITQYFDEQHPIEEILPATIAVDTLPLALEQAEELLTEWDAAVEAGLPHFRNALRLNDLLKSPAVATFLAADQQRFDLYREWHPKIQATFETLCRTAQPRAPERER